MGIKMFLLKNCIVSRILASGVELTETEEESPFRTAWTRQLGEQALINNVPKEVLNSLTRIIGWLTLDVVLYGGQGIGRGIANAFT